MSSLKFAIAPLSALACIGLCFGQAAPVRGSGIANPMAVATNADVGYCFARVRGLDPGRQPQAYLVVQLRVLISYRNAGTRPLIVPLERERTIYTGFKAGETNVFKEKLGLFVPALKVMKYLPADVGPDSPVDPKNDVFAVIPAGGEMTPPLLEEITLPASPKGLFKRSPDLRGHKVYLKLRFVHRQLSAALKTDLSDRWARFGVPWTGSLTTNTFIIDVPADPQAVPCKDIQIPAHAVEGLPHDK
jgi:hypothetical protein